MSGSNSTNQMPSRGFVLHEPRLSFVFLTLFSGCLAAGLTAALLNHQIKNQPPPFPQNTVAIVSLDPNHPETTASSTLAGFPEVTACLKAATTQFNLQSQDLWRLAGVKQALLVKNDNNGVLNLSLYWTANQPDSTQTGLIRWFLAQCLPGQTKITLPNGERITQRRTDQSPVSYKTGLQPSETVVSFPEHRLFYGKYGNWHILSSVPNIFEALKPEHIYCSTSGIRPGLFASFPPFFRACDQLLEN